MVLVGRSGCHLCEQAVTVVAQVVAEAGETWELVDVDGDPDLRARYGEMVPVVLVDGRQVDFHRIDVGRVRDALAGRRGWSWRRR